MPTTIDVDHATFVREEYRSVEAVNTAVSARNKTARALTIDTQLSQSAAQDLANKMLADGDQVRAFEITFDGLIDPSILIGGVPTWIINSVQYATDNRPFKLVGLTNDYEANRATIRVRAAKAVI